MDSVGTLLRSAREEQGRSVAEIAEDLCITQRYLRAIENDDLKSLPGVFFYKSFVRQYAAILGVEPKRFQPAMEALIAPLEEPAEPAPSAPAASAFASLIQPAPRSATAPVWRQEPMVQDFNRYFSDRRVGMSVASLAVVLLACSGFYAWWTKAPQAVAALPASPETVPAPAPLAVTLTGPAGAAVEAVAVPTTQDAEGLNHATLNVSATEATWLSITSDGKVIYSGILQPSQTKTLTGLEVARIRTGNAGALEVKWNGKPIGPIGGRGQVRTVVLTPQNFEILPPKPPSDL